MLKVLLTGGTGFIGTELTKALYTRDCDIYVLTRTPENAPSQVTAFTAIPTDLEFDVVINLAGHPIADGRWSKSTKDKIIISRLSTTQSVIDHIEGQSRKPSVFISGSAIGIYGIGKEDHPVSESDVRDTSFSSSLCYQWETLAQQASVMGVRTCLLRTGIVLGNNKGALKKMLPAFKLGLGGKIGNGQQWMPWIHITDVVNAILFCIDNDSIKGPINLTAPTPVTNKEFTTTLGQTLKRPTLLPLPSLFINLLMGQMGKELLLAGKKVIPKALVDAGYQFRYPELQSALTDVIADK